MHYFMIIININDKARIIKNIIYNYSLLFITIYYLLFIIIYYLLSNYLI